MIGSNDAINSRGFEYFALPSKIQIKPELKICGGSKEIMVCMSTLNDLICCGFKFSLDAASSLFSFFFGGKLLVDFFLETSSLFLKIRINSKMLAPRQTILW